MISAPSRGARRGSARASAPASVSFAVEPEKQPQRRKLDPARRRRRDAQQVVKGAEAGEGDEHRGRGEGERQAEQLRRSRKPRRSPARRGASAAPAASPRGGSVRCRLSPQPSRTQACSRRPDARPAAPGRRRAGSAPAAREAERSRRDRELHVSRERIGLLDRIDDHARVRRSAPSAATPIRARGFAGSDRKSPSMKDACERGGRRSRRERRVRGARSRSSVAIASAKRSTTPASPGAGSVPENRRARRRARTGRRKRARSERLDRSSRSGARLEPNCIEATGRTRSRPYAPIPIRARGRKRAPRAPSGASRPAKRARRKRTGGIARSFRPSPALRRP